MITGLENEETVTGLGNEEMAKELQKAAPAVLVLIHLPR